MYSTSTTERASRAHARNIRNRGAPQAPLVPPLASAVGWRVSVVEQRKCARDSASARCQTANSQRHRLRRSQYKCAAVQTWTTSDDRRRGVALTVGGSQGEQERHMGMDNKVSVCVSRLRPSAARPTMDGMNRVSSHPDRKSSLKSLPPSRAAGTQ
ncbi:hypothetical protein BCV70DRAFT_202009 [Testicularia cyperi]|uniref:Uncharacterized protein n=1 Tax=Testicularia cyperi TaxID=1882483 RepID=A0A317XK61_9BASI|nr:hypothetical protein BCV70DRAFT_202009 [Testicularia cyperi]